MTDSFIQLTTDGSGKKLDTVIVNLGVGSTELHREKLVIADPSSSGGYANVTSSQGLLVQATGPVSIAGTVNVVSASSGLVQISGIPVVAVSSSALAPVNIVTSSGAYVPTTTSAGLLVQATGPTTISGTVTVLSASSGLVQISGTPTVTMSTSTLVQANIVTSSGAYVPTTTGAGLLVQATGPVSVSGTVTVLSASSGLVQISGTPAVTIQGSSGGTVLVTTSGAMSVTISTAAGSGSTSVNILGTQNAMVSVATSGTFAGALVVFSTSGSGAASSQVNIVGTSSAITPATSSGGLLVTAIQSSVYTVTATAATNPWSSAPSFNVPVVSASSGLIQALASTDVLSSGSITASSQTQAFTVNPGQKQAAIQFFGSSWSGTIFIEHTVDGTNWASISALRDSQDLVTSITTGGVYTFPVSGLQQYRIHSSTNSGTIGWVNALSQGDHQTVRLAGPLPTSTNSIGLVQSTQGTNPWSSAPGFNLPVVSVSSGFVQISGTATIVSASSGLVQISGTPTVTMTTSNTNAVALVTSGQLYIGATTAFLPTFQVTTSGGTLVATTSFGAMRQLTTGKIVPVLQASSGVTSIDLWQGTSQKAPVFVTVTTVSKISSGSGNLVSVSAIGFNNTTSGISGGVIRFYNASTSNVTVGTSVVGILPLNMITATSFGSGGASAGAAAAHFLGPIGWGFPTACSVDCAVTATGAVVSTNQLVNATVTALYTT